ncbi:hypothetical protein FN846DRAFT_910890 [Sphaerosporella brunnea]|uniref:Uncharacterized protein n=1 Tax=Sphaerosporella brunnea TaxID=1250544 RepID=A0A5J5EKP5_9PEZI|nr:hypothetical protein FN846DRAFT_910890 [Sphaerosporella brunnea]
MMEESHDNNVSGPSANIVPAKKPAGAEVGELSAHQEDIVVTYQASDSGVNANVDMSTTLKEPATTKHTASRPAENSVQVATKRHRLNGMPRRKAAGAKAEIDLNAKEPSNSFRLKFRDQVQGNDLLFLVVRGGIGCVIQKQRCCAGFRWSTFAEITESRYSTK